MSPERSGSERTKRSAPCAAPRRAPRPGTSESAVTASASRAFSGTFTSGSSTRRPVLPARRAGLLEEAADAVRRSRARRSRPPGPRRGGRGRSPRAWTGRGRRRPARCRPAGRRPTGSGGAVPAGRRGPGRASSERQREERRASRAVIRGRGGACRERGVTNRERRERRERRETGETGEIQLHRPVAPAGGRVRCGTSRGRLLIAPDPLPSPLRPGGGPARTRFARQTRARA